MRTITPELVDALMDFAPAEADKSRGFAFQQRQGTVAIYNMLARNRCAYLADEVGMGKTYVALAVMSLLRYFNPGARIVVIAPRENIQLKWVKELHNFVRVNWKVIGNRVKAVQGGPVWEPVVCNNLYELAREAMINQDRDFFLRMSSFSLALNEGEARRKQRRRLREALPWVARRDVDVRTPDGFRESFGRTLNGAFPDADLLIFDEAHNLKHGFGPGVSNRNRILGFATGHPAGREGAPPWYRHRAQRVLLLSATPFEESYADLQRQLDVLGHGDAVLRDAGGRDPRPVRTLVDPGAGEQARRSVVERLLVRRASGLLIGGELHTKNMYRREWRHGGFERYDEPIEIADARQRLVVALMQKKVAEVLQSERFNNCFQIGMLSSFESFLESVGRMQRARDAGEDEEEGGDGAFDDAEQNRRASAAERQGADTEAVRRIVRSYRERFGSALPHPKLDAAARAHADVFETGEKALVFVRRVATVSELGAKLDEHFDRWVRARMEAALPGLRPELASVFARYERERLRRPEELGRHDLGRAPLPEEGPEELRPELERDEGGAESFFAWFFRGEGPRELLSGGAFQRNRLASTSSAYSMLFEDDHVAWLLGARGAQALDALARHCRRARADLARTLWEDAYAHFRARSRQREGYPRLYVFEAYQVAALRAMAAAGGALGERAALVLEERYPGPPAAAARPPRGFPTHRDFLGATTIFTELAARPGLCARLWPEDPAPNFRERFRRREQRRELLSAMMRLGAAYIDLYLLAIAALGSFASGQQREDEDLPARLARDWVERLDAQREEPGFHAFRELSLAAGAFDHVLAVNFPGVPAARLPEIARIYAATLQRQVPVGRMAGGVNKRLVRQFRMPGFPLVLVTTDVLQEGEDLHTFCRRVVHYGISWTSSATEQRTGRVDRIGGLVQRLLDGRRDPPSADELIQVYFPHLRDTVEVLQIRRVLRRLNRFIELMHVIGHGEAERESHLDAARAMLEETEDVPPITGRLESAFPVRAEWLAGELGAAAVDAPDWDGQFRHLASIWEALRERYAISGGATSHDHVYEGEVQTGGGRLVVRGAPAPNAPAQAFRMELRSQIAGDATLLRVSSELGERDLASDEAVEELDAIMAAGRPVKLCLTPRTHQDGDRLQVQGDILFGPEVTQLEDVAALLERTAAATAWLRAGTGWTPDGRKPDLEPLLERVDHLAEGNGLPWSRSGRTVRVELARQGRAQQVRLASAGGGYRFDSVVLAAHGTGPRHRRCELLRRAWIRNAMKDIVGFCIDGRGRLIGFVDQPAASLDEEELRLYIDAVARECDRFEYVLTGEDVL